MKIKKQVKGSSAVKASNIGPTTQTDFQEVATVVQGECPYDEAKCYIENAIKSLTAVADSDPIAKESIANLAVVLLDLSGNC